MFLYYPILLISFTAMFLFLPASYILLESKNVVSQRMRRWSRPHSVALTAAVETTVVRIIPRRVS